MARYARYARGAVYCPVCSACEAACTVRDDHARYYRCRVCGHRFAVPIETESA
jgi:transcription elongation factor Elf1